jgi:hypothetical protein
MVREPMGKDVRLDHAPYRGANSSAFVLPETNAKSIKETRWQSRDRAETTG